MLSTADSSNHKTAKKFKEQTSSCSIANGKVQWQIANGKVQLQIANGDGVVSLLIAKLEYYADIVKFLLFYSNKKTIYKNQCKRSLYTTNLAINRSYQLNENTSPNNLIQLLLVATCVVELS